MSLIFPWQRAPVAPTLQALGEGISWLRLPLPFALDHVNIWLLDSGDGTFVIDTGVASQLSKDLWLRVLSQLTNPPCGLLVTHYHPDHVGLAGWLAEQFSIPVWFSQQDLDYSREAHAISDAEFSAAQDSWYRLQGLDTKRRAAMRSAGNSYRPLVHNLPEQVTVLRNDDVWTAGRHDWRVITVGGHAPEMICLFCASRNILIAADQLLPSITPNVSLNHYTQDPDPLRSFLASLALFETLPEDVLVLPSHGLPFRGMPIRIAQLRAHHEERFALLLEACEEPASAADMLPVLFKRELDYQQLMFAMGESVAHLRFLSQANRLAICQNDKGQQLYTTLPA